MKTLLLDGNYTEGFAKVQNAQKNKPTRGLSEIKRSLSKAVTRTKHDHKTDAAKESAQSTAQQSMECWVLMPELPHQNKMINRFV